MSIIRIIAAGFLVCLIVMTSCLGLNHPTTSQTAIDKTLSAISQIKSYQLGTDFTDESGFTEWKGTKVIDVSNKEMAMNMTITMGPSSPPITVSDEMYFMGGVNYSEIISEENSPQTVGWTKSALVNDVWDQQTQILFLTELLKTATKISSLETQQLNNVKCYVLTITPSAQASADFVLSQGQPGGPAFYSPDIEGGWMITGDLFSSGSIELWISQNDYLPLKVETEFNFNSERGNLPANTTVSQVINNYQGELDFSDYNQSVSIQVPQDALNAPWQANTDN
jgi:hypothetical protein